MKKLLSVTTFSLFLLSQLAITPSAYGQSIPTVDACTREPRYCFAPARDAGEAFAQLLSTAKNPIAPHPEEFAELYGQLFTQFINSQVSNLSQGSSLAGFSFVRDTVTGALRLKSTSFGPLLSERPQTAGRKAFSFAITAQRTRFDTLDGVNLQSQGIVNDYDYTTSTAVTLPRNAATDVSFRYTSTFNLTTTSTIFGAAYGVTDRLDVSVAVPFVRTSLSGRTAQEFRTTTGGSAITSDVAGTSSGVGDITLRGKYNFRSGSTSEWAVLAEARLPTGDEESLLGLGKRQTKLAIVGSTTLGRVAPHWTFGYTWAGQGVSLGELSLRDAQLTTFRLSPSVVEPSNELNYSAGAEVAASPRLTLAAEVVGRTLRDSVRLDTVQQFSRANYARTLTFFKEVDSLNLLVGAVGAKWNLAGRFLLVGHVMFPLNDAGLRPGVTPVISLQRAF